MASNPMAAHCKGSLFGERLFLGTLFFGGLFVGLEAEDDSVHPTGSLQSAVLSASPLECPVPSMGQWMWGGKGHSYRAPVHFHFICLREEHPNVGKCCPEAAATAAQALRGSSQGPEAEGNTSLHRGTLLRTGLPRGQRRGQKGFSGMWGFSLLLQPPVSQSQSTPFGQEEDLFALKFS